MRTEFRLARAPFVFHLVACVSGIRAIVWWLVDAPLGGVAGYGVLGVLAMLTVWFCLSLAIRIVRIVHLARRDPGVESGV